MNEILTFGIWDYIAFIGFFVVLSLVGFLAGRKERTSKEEYFLAGKKLPWYVVGFSFIASNISSEHFIGMIGAAYIYGICVSMYSWMNVLSYTFLVWLFIPFLLSSK
ncbi:MAG: Na+/glucose cotransporter, partial [Chlorobi bacterium]|nr:Na+/glucose cotransporter [Chlorobiota bacterium]